MRFILGSIAALAIGSAGLQAQTRVTVADLGPGASGRIIQEALAKPHRLIEPDSAWFILGRDQREPSTLVVLGRSAAIAGSVDGDVVVVGGDLFVRPAAHISGTAVAIGGAVYPSSLAIIEQGAQSFRDNTFSISRTPDGYRLEYVSLRVGASPPLLFPDIYGFRLPIYDRVNGVSVPFGPALSFASGRGELDVLATYRSDLGKVDPSLDGALQLSRRTRAHVDARRGTISNDDWIWSDFVNSMSVLFFGTDTRNYFRADRAELTLHHLWELTQVQIEPFVGGVAERAWSVGPVFGEQRGPWSLVEKTDSLGMWRPNPAIVDGHIASALVGSALQWEAQQLKLSARSGAEIALSSPVSLADRHFVQITSDVGVSFPTFGEQTYAVDVHWVTTPSGTPPPQRFAYLGGPGTLPFTKVLEQGGDELLLIDQRYSYPLPNVRFGILGVPTLLLRHRIGSAGMGRLPSFEQMIGAGVLLTIVRAEVQIDPASGRVRGGVGFSFSR